MDSPLEDMIDFLEKFDWIYNFKLTNFFIDQVWEKIPCEVGTRLYMSYCGLISLNEWTLDWLFVQSSLYIKTTHGNLIMCPL
jgi:hypothetical protein